MYILITNFVYYENHKTVERLKICYHTQKGLLDTPLFVAVWEYINGSECRTVEIGKSWHVKQSFWGVVARQISTSFHNSVIFIVNKKQFFA